MFAKKCVSIIMIIAMVYGILAIPAAAYGTALAMEDPGADDLQIATAGSAEHLGYYFNGDGTVTVCRYVYAMPAEFSLEIPSQIEGCPVTKISSQAFEGEENLVAVTIPDSVVSIQDNAFSNCTNLTSVTMGSALKSLGSGAFENTPWYEGLTDEFVVLDNGLLIKHNPQGAVETLTIPGTVKYIGDYFFSEEGGIKNLTISEGVIGIGNRAFYGCASLEGITLPAAL